MIVVALLLLPAMVLLLFGMDRLETRIDPDTPPRARFPGRHGGHLRLLRGGAHGTHRARPDPEQHGKAA
ncbi:hypothetical protein AB0J38_07790 [Streptomyces sp. NPDC050095]|uniref:hypothetical protein n=1 Tax=unclassified Streptomyces TaxID=2593676 RepID=UPI00342AD412